MSTSEPRSRSWVCCFCSKPYRRSDVLRRHYINCPSRGPQPIPGRLKKGKKTRACDACARLKLGCDLDCPCETCLSYGLECTYTRIAQQPLPGSELAPDPTIDATDRINQRRNDGSLPRPKTLSRQERSKISLAFLLNYVNPATNTIAGTYGRGTERPGASPPISSTALNGIAGSDLGILGSTQQLVFDEYIAPFNVDRLDEFFVSYLFPDSEDLPSTASVQSWPLSGQGSDPPAALSIACATNPFSILVDSLTEFTVSLPQIHPEAAPNDQLAKATALFSRENIERFIGHYFRDYCPHNPVLYPGTFQASSASPCLLLVVVVTGALFSSGINEIEQARGILNLVEEYAFNNTNFRKLLGGSDAPVDSNDPESWQALQAAFFITQVQLREGSPAKRKEARSFRFEEIICAVRALGLLEAQNSFFHTGPPAPERFQWRQYGDSETRIRLVCGVFNLDASFSILYNMIPRLFTEELEIDMPGPVEAFFADNAQDCYQTSVKEHGFQTLRFSKLCTALLQDEWDEHLHSSMQSLSIHNLFSLILALLQILWLSPYRPGKGKTMERIAGALERWKQIWDFQNTTLTARQRERYGFLKTAPLEFWQIATVLIKKKATRLDTAVDQSNIPAVGNNRHGNCIQCAHELLESVDREQV